MKDADRQRIERCLEEFDAWRASGIPLKIYVQQRGENLAHWRARLSWESRWRQMLAGTYAKKAAQAGAAFVRAVPNTVSAGQMPNAKPVQPPSQRPDCLHIVLSNPAGALQASVHWPLSQLSVSSAWLREVLA